MLKADLHIHTTASDGKLTPAKTVSLASERKLDVIAITDHDTISGVEEAKMASKEYGITVIRGAEISTLFEGREAHLLAYGFEDSGIMQRLFSYQKNRRRQRAKVIIANLNKLGFDITYDEVLGEAGSGTIGRPHIARVMIRKGFAVDTRDVFFRYLGNHSKAYHRIDYPDISEAIDKVHQAGGCAVLAHPADNYNFIELRRLKDYGLDGIECYHPSHSVDYQRRYMDYCHINDLIVTGGSDFHGKVQDFYHLGVVYVKLGTDSPLLNISEIPSSGVTGTYPHT
ncbi:MAG: PHP domain-containing protein [Balneolales bacterium]